MPRLYLPTKYVQDDSAPKVTRAEVEGVTRTSLMYPQFSSPYEFPQMISGGHTEYNVEGKADVITE